jgi:hypothetical protein
LRELRRAIQATGHDTATLEAFSGALGGYRAGSANRFANPYPCGWTPNAALSKTLMPPVGFAFETIRKFLP